MKLLISLLLLLPVSTHARVIVISYAAGIELSGSGAQNIQQVMIETYHIPREFIQLEASLAPCSTKRESMSWHLCIDTSGDLYQVSVDPSFIQETLRVFL
jgi:hypothetical protein